MTESHRSWTIRQDQQDQSLSSWDPRMRWGNIPVVELGNFGSFFFFLVTLFLTG